MLQSPISRPKAAIFKKQLTGWQKRLPRLEIQLATCQQVASKHQQQLLEQQTTLTALLAWRAKLETDNLSNPNPPPYVEARMDAGFAAGHNLTWLLELGYCPNTKAPNGHTATALRACLPKRSRCVKVGANAEMLGWGEYHLHDCPYPLTVALERFWVRHAYKYAALIHYRDDDFCPTLPVWFQHYN
ncbi:MAG: hypothetical protein HY872_02550 [Chloroflexi bacterium]|nr:hypothetical protein [Chloroflexota bacterium]